MNKTGVLKSFPFKDVSGTTLREFLSRLQSYEAGGFADRAITVPWTVWQIKEVQDLAGEIADDVIAWTKEQVLSQHDRLICCAIIIRLYQGTMPDDLHPDFTTLKQEWSVFPDASKVEVLYYFLNQNRLFLLNQYCREYVANDWGQDRLTQVFDMYFLSAYRLLVQKMTQGKDISRALTHMRRITMKAKEALPAGCVNFWVYKAITCICEDDREEGYLYFRKAGKAPGSLFGVLASAVHVAYFETLDEAPDTLRNLPSLSAEFTHGKGGKAILISCDQLYFQKYIEGYVSSVGHHQPDCLVHLHCVGFSPDRSHLGALEKEFSVRINFTVDMYIRDTEAVTNDMKYGYCSLARYLWLDFYMQQYQAIFISDIDGVLIAPLDEKWTNSRYDVQFASMTYFAKRHVIRAPWDRISAGLVLVLGSSGGKQFARLISAVLWGRFLDYSEKQDVLFFADQAALAYVYRCLSGKVSFGKIGTIFKQADDLVYSSRFDAKQAWQRDYLTRLNNQKTE